MTSIAAMGAALLRGDTLSIMDGFRLFSISNLPREISRSIEQKFHLRVSRDQVNYISKNGVPGYYYRYRLNRTEQNKEGINKLKAYVKKEMQSEPPPKTDKEAKRQKNTQTLLKLF